MRRQVRSAFTLFQLLIVLAILLILLALLLPAHRQGAGGGGTQPIAEQSQANGARSAQLQRHLTPCCRPASMTSNFSAASKLLPFIEQQNVFNKIDFKKSIDDKANTAAAQIRVSRVFLSPRGSDSER